MPAESQPRESSRLEIDDSQHCLDCGIALPFDALLLYDLDRCPECHLEREKKRVMAAYGSTETVDAMASWDITETVGKSGENE